MDRRFDELRDIVNHTLVLSSANALKMQEFDQRYQLSEEEQQRIDAAWTRLSAAFPRSRRRSNSECLGNLPEEARMANDTDQLVVAHFREMHAQLQSIFTKLEEHDRRFDARIRASAAFAPWSSTPSAWPR
jgi:hypothetical protein